MQTAATNVPGPRFPLYLLGRRMVEIHPYVPIGNNIRTAIGIFSYLDQLNFGVTGDMDAVPDIGVLSGGIRAGIDELLEHASPEPAAREKPAKPAATVTAAKPAKAPRKAAKKAVRPPASRARER
jgi:hypothetical protein